MIQRAVDTSNFGVIPSCTVSGDLEADCAYLMTLPERKHRACEITRLGAIYGRYYQEDIQRRFTEIWNAK